MFVENFIHTRYATPAGVVCQFRHYSLYKHMIPLVSFY